MNVASYFSGKIIIENECLVNYARKNEKQNQSVFGVGAN